MPYSYNAICKRGSFPNFILQYTIKPSAMDSMRSTNTSHTCPLINPLFPL